MLSVVALRSFTAAAPGFPRFLLAVFAGTVSGALAGSLLGRLTPPLKKVLPTLS